MEKSILRCLYLKKETANAKQEIKPRVPGTLDWVLGHGKYLEWQDSKSSAVFWISAPPGYGKTVMASLLKDIQVLYQKQRPKSRKSTVCSFFCGSQMENQKSAVTVLRMILW